MTVTSVSFTLRPTGIVGPWSVDIQGWRPATVNHLMGRNWQKSARLKREDRERLFYYFHEAQVPKAHTRRRITMTLTYPNGSYPDPDNVWKSVLDGLVNIGALVDDHEAWVETMPVLFARGPKATLIHLEDLT